MRVSRDEDLHDGERSGRDRSLLKKRLALSVGIHCRNIARVIDEFDARPKEASASDLDEKVHAASRADAREQLSVLVSSIAESCKITGTQTHRAASVLTGGGRITFRFPYAPKAGVTNAVLGKLGCEPGKARATPVARRIIAESSA